VEALADESISRRHASVAFDGRRWTVRDHGSRNGTLVDGERVAPERVVSEVPGRTHVLRLGRVIALLVADLRPFAGGITIERGVVSGPTLTAAWREITAAARAAGPLHVVGESGSGLAELDALVEAKLLRVLETREATPLGGVKARRVTFRLCTATHRDLRAAVADDRFREDLYYRIGRPAARIPPLRERTEEIPWIVAQEVARAKLAVTVHPSFAEVRTAAQTAALAGRASIGATDLDEGAGEELAGPERAEGEGPGRSDVEEALERAAGNVSAAARSLGVHRNQLRLLIARHDIDGRRFAKSGDGRRAGVPSSARRARRGRHQPRERRHGRPRPGRTRPVGDGLTLGG
jgi:hypothetical protein